jgi:hypothetical protein
MRELTVRVRFTGPSLGNVKSRDGAVSSFVFHRNDDGRIVFLASWHRANMRFAAQLLGKHYDHVQHILWDVVVDGGLRKGREKWFSRYFSTQNGRRRYVKHEAFQVGQTVGINCAVPQGITDDELLQLMNLAGRYKGLSPWKPGEYGHFEVESIQPRRRRMPDPDGRTIMEQDRAVK